MRYVPRATVLLAVGALAGGGGGAHIHRDSSIWKLEASNPIPVLGVTAFLSGPLISRLLHSLDTPVGALALVDQPGTGPSVGQAISNFIGQQKCVESTVPWPAVSLHSSASNLGESHISRFVNPHLHCTPQLEGSLFSRILVFRNQQNTGCSHAWNLVLRYAWRIGAPYAVLTDGDIFFPPGNLSSFHTFVVNKLHAEGTASQQHTSNPTRTQPSGGFFTALTNQGGVQPFSMFAISLALVRRAGLFDENIFPPYYEDFEYNLRMNVLGVPVVTAPLHVACFVHGGMKVKDHWTGGELLGDFLAAEQRMQGLRAATSMYIAAKWGFVLRYDKWGWGKFTPKLPPPPLAQMIREAERAWHVPPPFATPWNESGPLGRWQFLTARHAFIRSNEALDTFQYQSQGHGGSCNRRAQRMPQLMIMGMGFGDTQTDTLVQRLRNAGYFVGLSTAPFECASDDKTNKLGKEAQALVGALRLPSKQSRWNMGTKKVGVQEPQEPLFPRNKTELLLHAANGGLVELLYRRRFSSLASRRHDLEYLLSLHSAHGRYALLLSDWSALLLPLMRDLVREPHCVLLVAPPDVAARNIAEAFGLPITLAMVLWEAHMLLSLRACDGVPKTFVTPERLSRAAMGASGMNRLLFSPCRPDGSLRTEGQLREMDAEPRLYQASRLRRNATQHAELSEWSLYESLVNGSARAWTESDIPTLSVQRAHVADAERDSSAASQPRVVPELPWPLGSCRSKTSTGGSPSQGSWQALADHLDNMYHPHTHIQ